MKQVQTTCCIVGGGPAGIMLGYLLARAGVDVVVLEKHKDFLRDFRGDTIHPSTLEIIHELGLLEEFLKRPHQELKTITGQIGDTTLTLADFTHLPTKCKFIALMPQWDFLDFITQHARAFPTFRIIMQAAASDLIMRDGRVVGISATTPEGPLQVDADLIIGADGRHSVVRERAGLDVLDLGAPIDVLWMRISKHADDPVQTFGRIGAGRVLVMLDRGDYYQCAYVIRKNGFEEITQRGLEAFRNDLAQLAPFLRDRVAELKTWDDIKVLTVRVDRLKTWHRPGLLCIGDAAHAMSPIGGVGINLAIQDAVAAANILALPLHDRLLTEAHLHQVQQRRELPTRLTQALQLTIQNRLIGPVLNATGAQIRVPLAFRLLLSFKRLRRIPARMVGLGFRPEHVRTLDRFSRG